MSSYKVPPPLRDGSELITYPFINSDDAVSPVRALMVNIHEEDNVDTISLKFCVMKYYPSYTNYLNKNRENNLHGTIEKYYNTMVETAIHYVCIYYLMNKIYTH